MSVILNISTITGILLLSVLGLSLVYASITVFIEHFADTNNIKTDLRRHQDILDHYRVELDNLTKKNKK